MMAKDKKFTEKLRDRTFGAMLADAIFRLESAITIALTIILTGFAAFSQGGALNIGGIAIPWFVWLLFGLITEAVLVLSHLTDPESSAEAVERLLRETYNPAEIRNPKYRRKVEEALERRALIQNLVEQESGALRVNLSSSAQEVEKWIARIYQLARRLDSWDQDDRLEQDRKNAEAALMALEMQLEVEENEKLVGDIERAIQTRKTQIANLRDIANQRRRSELQLDNTLASLETVYAQMLRLDSKDIDSGRARRLQSDITEQVNQLEDTILAMDDVQQQSTLDY